MAVKELAKAGAGVAETFPSGAISIALVVLGSVLALATSFAMEVWRARRADRRKVLLLKRFLQQEIPLFIITVNKLLSIAEEARLLPKVGVQSLNRARQGFDRNRESATFIEDNDLRHVIFGYFSMVDALCYGVEELAEASSKERLSVEIIQEFTNVSRQIEEAGESLLKRLRKL